MVGEGIGHLRAKRGHEQVTFKDVCDHLDDYVRIHPSTASVLDDFASFIARVEDVDHAHEGGPPTIAAAE